MRIKTTKPFGGIVTALSMGAITSMICVSNVGAAQHPNYDPNQRAERQQDHVQHGIKSGQLTKREAARIQRHEKNIKTQLQSDRAANGGQLTTAERRQVVHAQNRAAHNIYELKHNQDTAPQQ